MEAGLLANAFVQTPQRRQINQVRQQAGSHQTKYKLLI